MSQKTRFLAIALAIIILTASTTAHSGVAQTPGSAAALLDPNIPVQVFPQDGINIPIKRVVYVWAAVPGATQYMLQVYQGTTRILAKALGTTACVSDSCTYRHPVDLANGTYKWRIRATVGGVAQNFSPALGFTVAAPTPTTGFYSPFTSDAVGWVMHSGLWNLEASNYFTTQGVSGVNPGYTSTISHQDDYSTLTYEVRMKRDGCAGNANAIIIRGNPVLDSAGWWKTEYTFDYTNTGVFSVWRDSNGTYTALSGGSAGWVYSDKIKKSDWNVLKVKASGSSLYFYINDYLVWSGVDSAYASGRVGIAMYRGYGCTGDKLWVDWAKLDTTVTDLPAADQLLEPAEGVPGGTRNTAP